MGKTHPCILVCGFHKINPHFALRFMVAWGIYGGMGDIAENSLVTTMV
jgi:hypothetical protein